MKTRRVLIAHLILIASVVVLHPTAAEAQARRGQTAAPGQTGSKARFASGNSAIGIPFELDNNLILLNVRVNNSRPLRFIFDTGASITVTTPQIAARLGLGKGGQKIKGLGTGGSFEATIIQGVRLSVAGVEVARQPVALFPFGPVGCFKFDGIIGYDFINEFVVEIDYVNRKMNLYDPRSYKYSGSGEVIPITLPRKPFVRVAVRLPGREPVEGPFEIDTGADGTMTIYRPFIEKHKLDEALGGTLQGTAAGAGGEQEFQLARVPGLQIGSIKIENPLVGFAQKREEAEASEENAGLIGGEILRRFKLILDYSRKQLILEPNAGLADAYETDMSGLTVGTDARDCKLLKVEGVGKGTPAAEAGMIAGDIITSIDGKPMQSFTDAEMERLFSQDGREMLLGIRRGKRVLTVKIKLRRLL